MQQKTLGPDATLADWLALLEARHPQAIDMIVDRREMRDKLAHLITLLTKQPATA